MRTQQPEGRGAPFSPAGTEAFTWLLQLEASRRGQEAALFLVATPAESRLKEEGESKAALYLAGAVQVGSKQERQSDASYLVREIIA